MAVHGVKLANSSSTRENVLASRVVGMATYLPTGAGATSPHVSMPTTELDVVAVVSGASEGIRHGTGLAVGAQHVTSVGPYARQLDHAGLHSVAVAPEQDLGTQQAGGAWMRSGMADPTLSTASLSIGSSTRSSTSSS